ncbi:MAG TPA: MBL fold metallo-hydrolase [Opitutaceae bacterium]|nr:MBL fold metallo-hydrolase [Opitutaceae bacterium]
MRKPTHFFAVGALLCARLLSAQDATAMAQTREVGPYTLHPIIPGVTRIEDANHLNPAGIHLGADGNPTGLNNCSDMYLIVGGDKALLIDLSNFVTWDPTAVASLQALVREEIGARKLSIAFTHHHGDHTGMLPAFKGDENVTFWIQTAEFEGRDLFPAGRTTSIAANPSLDLGGGVVVDALEIPGHTDHSTAYFLKGKNLLFSGDGIGSGNGVWIFSADGFARYRQSVGRLIDCIRNPVHGVDESKLLIFGGHYWQKREKEKLTMQYVLDMQQLIAEIKAGRAREEPMTFNKYLDTNFSHGEATITWNKADAEKFRAE